MAAHLISSSFLVSSFFLLSSFPLHSEAACPSFHCGNLSIDFPFYVFTDEGFRNWDGRCGFLPINCSDGVPKILSLDQEKRYLIKNISYNEKKALLQDWHLLHQFQQGGCGLDDPFEIPAPKFLRGPTLTLFHCNLNEYKPFDYPTKEYYNYTLCSGKDVLFFTEKEVIRPPLEDCTQHQLPIQPSSSNSYRNDSLLSIVEAGFTLSWDISPSCINDCLPHNRLCEPKNGTTLDFTCPGPPQKEGRKKTKSIVWIAIGVGVGALFCVVVFASVGYLWCQGGYGSAFKGKLNHGRVVAVKVLNNSKGNGEEFINEVASIGRTYHINIVRLLGFCSEGSKRALLYEFMPNGSLEKFIFSQSAATKHALGFEKLFQIAIGIARGLEYLHRGCSMRILHFDIKPHDILLDDDFCPKISDFGLAKICPGQESVISMTNARGTVGYIEPEVFCRNIGGVSHKYDVYSYGMMILEMVGGRKNIDALVENTSEVYFPHWIYHRIIQNENLEIFEISTAAEEITVQKMILVGLWCIQTDSANRPSISKVVEMLEGSLENLQMPPMPYLSSPSRIT